MHTTIPRVSSGMDILVGFLVPFLSVGTSLKRYHSDLSTNILLDQLLEVLSTTSASIIISDNLYDNITKEIMPTLSEKQRVQQYNLVRFGHVIGPYITQTLTIRDLKRIKHSLHFVLLCNDCVEDVISTVTTADNTHGFRSTLRHFSTWVIISSGGAPSVDTVLDNVAYLQLPPNQKTAESSEVHAHTGGLQVSTLLWRGSGRQWTRVNTPSTSSKMLFEQIFPNTLTGLNERTLTLVAIQWRPVITREIKNGSVQYTGSAVETVNILARQLNFSYILIEATDDEWGVLLDNGSWTGPFKLLQQREADMCLSPYSISLERWKVVQFSSPYYGSYFVAVYKAPQDSAKLTFFISQFHWHVYLVGFAAILMTSTLYRLTGQPTHGLFSVFILIGLQIPLRQGLEQHKPRRISAAIILWTWCMFCFLVTAVYCGVLVAYASSDKTVVPFSTVRELAEQGEYKIGGFEGSVATETFQFSKNPLFQKIYEKMKRNLIPVDEKNIDRAQERLETGRFVLIAGAQTTVAMLKARMCNLVTMREKLFSVHRGFIFPLQSPITLLVDEKLKGILESGVFDRLTRRVTPDAQNCTKNLSSSHQFQMDDFKIVLAACLTGMLVSVIVLVLERHHDRLTAVLRRHTFFL